MPPPKNTVVDLIVVDRASGLKPGVNPLKMDELKIPFVARVDERASAAKKAAEERMSRPCDSIRHGENGRVMVIFSKVGV